MDSLSEMDLVDGCMSYSSRLSKTTDDIPDQIQDLLSRHINVVSPMVSGQPTTTDERCSQSFDLGDRRDPPVVVKPPPKPQLAVSSAGDVVLRKPRTRGRPLNARECVVSTLFRHCKTFSTTHTAV